MPLLAHYERFILNSVKLSVLCSENRNCLVAEVAEECWGKRRRMNLRSVFLPSFLLFAVLSVPQHPQRLKRCFHGLGCLSDGHEGLLWKYRQGSRWGRRETEKSKKLWRKQTKISILLIHLFFAVLSFSATSAAKIAFSWFGAPVDRYERLLWK